MITLVWLTVVLEGYQNVDNIYALDDYDCQSIPFIVEADMPPPDYLHVKLVVCCEEKCVIDYNID